MKTDTTPKTAEPASSESPSTLCCASLPELAEKIATKAHAGQFRRDGITPYIQHPAAVVARLAGESDQVIAIAWLHDVIEDTEETGESLLRAGIPADVVSSIKLLTKTSGVRYQDYLERLAHRTDTRKVKIADMLANLADSPTERQIVKYASGLIYLHNDKDLARRALDSK